MMRRILTLDDDPEINTYLKTILIKEGYKVETTTNFNDFFKYFKRNRPDLCIVDLNLDDAKGAGFNILKAIRNKFGKGVRVIIVSRRFAEEDIIHALNEGANDYITKPLDDMIVISKVNSTFGDLFRESSALPFYAVASVHRDLFLELEFKVMTMSEEGIYIFSPHFISKGNTVRLTGNLASTLTNEPYLSTTISEITKNNQLNGYIIKLSFNVEDEDVIKSARKLLLGL